jgi:hypothetical protein
MDIIIAELAFLELATEEQLELRTAVKRMEAIAWSLKQLAPGDLATFIARTREVAPQYTADARRFVEAIPTDLGLVDEADGPDEAEVVES